MNSNSKFLIRILSAIALVFVSLICLADNNLSGQPTDTTAETKKDETPAPDILSLPRLARGLPVGAIAWATINQLHPTQPQTGKREVTRKSRDFEALLPKDNSKFPKKLYEDLYHDSITPVYIATTPPQDSRYGQEPVLGYVTDRTHGSNAMGEMIKKTWGKKALRAPILDDKGRPLNFVIVQVRGDLSDKTPGRFAAYMVQNNFGYLKLWSRAKDGSTAISDISFFQLPENVMDTTDNPYRALVGELQHEKKLRRVATDFSQFIDAEGLLSHHVVSWDQISLDASDKVYGKALKAAEDFFNSPEAAGLPGAGGK